MARLVSVGILMALVASVGMVAASGRAILQETAPFDVSGIPGYVAFVTKGCASKPISTETTPKGLPVGLSKDTTCAALQDARYGIPSFRIYQKDNIVFVTTISTVRTEMLKCSGSSPSCKVAGDGGGALAGKAVDVKCLAAFVNYAKQCYKKTGAPAATCAKLSGDHCSCAGVKCGADKVTFGSTMTCSYADATCSFIRGTSTSG